MKTEKRSEKEGQVLLIDTLDLNLDLNMPDEDDESESDLDREVFTGKSYKNDLISKRTIALEQDLVKRVQEGDQEAFGVLYHKYMIKLQYDLYSKKLAHRLEDLVAEALIKAYENIGFYKPVCSFYSWVKRIAVNLVKDEVRSMEAVKHGSGGVISLDSAIVYRNDEEEAIKFKDIVSDDFTGKKKDVVEKMNDRGVRKRIRKAINGLKGQSKMVFILFYFFDMKYEEMVDFTGISMNNIKSIVSRSKIALGKDKELEMAFC
jgi:RNA polymerase sigma-70 factor (ECF subfamily)